MLYQPTQMQLLILYRNPGWEFYHEISIRAASTLDFWKRVTGKEGIKKRWCFPLLLFAILFKGLNLNFTTFVENPSGFFLYKNVLYRAAISISALRGRLGRYAHAYGICAPFYCISLKIIYDGGYNADRDLISRDTALHTHFKFTLFLISILSYPLPLYQNMKSITNTRKTPQPPSLLILSL